MLFITDKFLKLIRQIVRHYTGLDNRIGVRPGDCLLCVVTPLLNYLSISFLNCNATSIICRRPKARSSERRNFSPTFQNPIDYTLAKMDGPAGVNYSIQRFELPSSLECEMVSVARKSNRLNYSH